MATIAEVKRALMARVEGIGGLEIAVTGPFQVTLQVTAAPGVDEKDLSERIRSVLEYVRPLGYRYDVTFDTSIKLPSAPVLEGRFSLATLDVDFREEGVKEALLKLVPSLSRLVIEEHSSGSVEERCIRFRVGAAEQSVLPKVLSDMKKAVSAIGFAGLRYEVVPLGDDDFGNELVNCGIFVPRREERLDRFAEEDEEVFAERLKCLMADQAPRIPLIDGFEGSSVLWGVQFQGGAAPLSCFLPLYDRVLVMMPPELGAGAADYYQQNFGMSQADFLAYCSHGKVIPIFKFAVGNFPDEVVRPILENPALSFVSPRELDYLAARYAWTDFGVIKALRDDRHATQLLFDALRGLRQTATGTQEHALKLAEDMLHSLLVFSERFEGLMWRQGHIQLANFTPAMLSVRGAYVRAGDNSAQSFTIFSDIMGSAMELALAQSMRASLHAGMVLNEPLLALVAAQFQGNPAYITKREAARLPQVLSALDLAYNDTISPQEYLDVFDQSETRRIRNIVREVLNTGSDDAKEQEVRERIHGFNDGVRRLRSKALELADVGVLGHTANGVDVPSGRTAMLEALGAFSGLGALLRKAGAQAFEQVVEDTEAGAMLDRLRGVVNRVPAQSVRLYRVRRKLGRIVGRVDVPATRLTPTRNEKPATTYVLNISDSNVGAVAMGEHSRAEVGSPSPPTGPSTPGAKNDRS